MQVRGLRETRGQVFGLLVPHDRKNEALMFLFYVAFWTAFAILWKCQGLVWMNEWISWFVLCNGVAHDRKIMKKTLLLDVAFCGFELWQFFLQICQQQGESRWVKKWLVMCCQGFSCCRVLTFWCCRIWQCGSFLLFGQMVCGLLVMLAKFGNDEK